MAKTVIILSIVILLLLIVLSFQIPKIQAAEQKQQDAEALAVTARQLLVALDVRCIASPRDIQGIRKCILPVLETNNFETDIFRPYNERKNETGVFVIVNEGAKTYNGSKFVLFQNGEELTTGCHIQTEILTEYTCRFDLLEPCIEGDVYEISYVDEETSRLVTRTCS